MQRETWAWGNKWNIKKNTIYKNESRISEMKNTVEQINHLSLLLLAKPHGDTLQSLLEPVLSTTCPDIPWGDYILFHFSVFWDYFFSVWSPDATWTTGGRHPSSDVPLWPLIGALSHSIINSATVVFPPQLLLELYVSLWPNTGQKSNGGEDGFILAHSLRGYSLP